MLCNDHKGRESVSIISTPFIVSLHDEVAMGNRHAGDSEVHRSVSVEDASSASSLVHLPLESWEIWSLPRRMVDIHKLTACSSSSSQVARRHPDATSLWPPDACTTGLDHALTQGQEMTATQRSGSACAPRPEGAHG